MPGYLNIFEPVYEEKTRRLCSYCGTGDHTDNKLCDSCGAPLRSVGNNIETDKMLSRMRAQLRRLNESMGIRLEN
jgi:predicted amidophosphoribosyltransferase